MPRRSAAGKPASFILDHLCATHQVARDKTIVVGKLAAEGERSEMQRYALGAVMRSGLA